jgi:hypothetical protein
MSALNMAMNGNAYKMIEIKKVSGPVVPLTSLNPLNPLTTLTDRYEPLPNPQNQQRIYTDLSLNHNPAYNPHSQPNGSTSYTPLTQANGSTTLQRPVPPPPPSRDGTLSRVDTAAPARGDRAGESTCKPSGGVEGGAGAAGTATASPPGRPHEETNGVAVVSQQELEFNTKEDEKWWWVCCLEFCFCLL